LNKAIGRRFKLLLSAVIAISALSLSARARNLGDLLSENKQTDLS